MAKVFDEIVAANKNFMAAFDGGDAEGLSKLYTEDCKVLPSGAPVQCGRKAVAELFGGLMGALKKVVLTTKEVGPEDPLQDMVFERGVYEFFDEKGQQADLGKYVVVWKRVDGKWYLYTDIFNTDLPSK